MGKELPSRDDLALEYEDALQLYLRQGGEASLEKAYELGRRGLGEGKGVLTMVAAHHQAMIQVLANSKPPNGLGGDAIKRAGIFFTECMSPFEMTHRSVGEANEALRHMNQSLEEEVKRIAHSLHDEAAQLLAAVNLSLDQVEREIYPFAQQRLQDVKDLLKEVDLQIRRLSHELRPSILDDLGLVPAIEFLSEGVAKRSGLRISIRSLKGERLPAPLETVLYRVVQEALNNVVRHARATSVRIRLQNSGKTVLCAIVDDGVGFNPVRPIADPKERGFGLLGMREKLYPLGGVVRIESAPGQGTKLFIEIPREVQFAD
jgi:signal transduction histidine kinase